MEIEMLPCNLIKLGVGKENSTGEKHDIYKCRACGRQFADKDKNVMATITALEPEIMFDGSKGVCPKEGSSPIISM